MLESDRNLTAPVYSGSLLTAWRIEVCFVGQAGCCSTYPNSNARLSKTFFREKSILRSVYNFFSFCACREARVVEVWLNSFLTSAMDRGEWSGWRPLPRHVRRKKPIATVNSRLGGCSDLLITSSPKSPSIVTFCCYFSVLRKNHSFFNIISSFLTPISVFELPVEACLEQAHYTVILIAYD